jgi:hypothetical protein
MSGGRAAAAALLLGLAACTTSTPGGPPAVDAAPGGSPDAAPPACQLSPGLTTGKLIRVAYLVPSDREEDPRYTANLTESIRDLQLWYLDHMPARTSFRVHDPVVEVFHTDHPAAWYATNGTDADHTYYFWNNALADATAASGAPQDDPDNVWLYYVAADTACVDGDDADTDPDHGQIVGLLHHLAIFTENDLRGLVGDAQVPTCPGDGTDDSRCIAVGSMGTMMTVALGVPFPPGCTDSDDTTPCDDHDITWLGRYDYPDATLSSDEAAMLADNPFVNAVGLPDCQLDCSAAVTP